MHKNKPAKSRRPSVPHQIRIIGGQWKRTPLAVLDAEGLRPTPDRVRETVFNWLTHLLDGEWANVRCLDLFAGTGALGFEAASRGAAEVLMIEQQLPAFRQLEATREKLRAMQVQLVRSDALAKAKDLVARQGATDSSGVKRFDIIFLDPPYHQGWLEKMLPWCALLLAEDGLVYAESELPLSELAPESAAAGMLQNWEIIRADKAGMVFYHLLRYRNRPEIQA